ncbi:MAG: Solanesyl diphosphate synthase, partial [uncultured Actinomycetospora sp.]
DRPPTHPGRGPAHRRPGPRRGRPRRPRPRRGPAAPRGAQRLPLRHRHVAAPHRGRRQAFPAAADPARRAARGRDLRRRRRRSHVGGARAPGDAVPRRRHGRGDDAPRRPERQRALGQHRRDPHRRLPVRTRLAARVPARPGRGADHRRDVRRARHGADARDPRAPRGRGRRRARPGRRGREDGFADRDLGAVRGDVRRGAAGARDGDEPVRGDHRDRVPGVRRHHRHRLAVRGLGQDPGHRPARGRRDAAGALHAGRRRPGGRAAADPGRRHPGAGRRRGRRGAGAAARLGGAPGGPHGPRRPRRRRPRGARRPARGPGPPGPRGAARLHGGAHRL